MLSSPFIGATVDRDPILLSDEELDALGAPLANKLAGSAVNLHPVELSHFWYDGVWMSVWQIVEPKFPLWNFQRSRKRCCLHRGLQTDLTTELGLLWGGLKNDTAKIYQWKMESKKVSESSRKKDKCWHYWIRVTVVAVRAASRLSKHERNERLFCLIKASTEKVQPLERPKQWSCCEWQTRLQRFGAWTSRFRPLYWAS